MRQDHVSGWVSVLCWLAAPVSTVLWKSPGICYNVIRKEVRRSSSVTMSRFSEISYQWRVPLYVVMYQNVKLRFKIHLEYTGVLTGCRPSRFERKCMVHVKQETQMATNRAPEYNVPPFWRIGQGGHLVFRPAQKNTNLVMVEDVEIFLPSKFRCRPFSGLREEVENVSANQRPVRLSCFSNQPE